MWQNWSKVAVLQSHRVAFFYNQWDLYIKSSGQTVSSYHFKKNFFGMPANSMFIDSTIYYLDQNRRQNISTKNILHYIRLLKMLDRLKIFV